MKLQTKLTGAFFLLAGIMLIMSVLAYRNVHVLSSALYEVGVVRLPSIEGLGAMRTAMAELQLSAHAILADRRPGEAEEDSQQRAWARFEAGWKLYEPLPQTSEEAEMWRQFVSAAREWRAEYTTAVDALRRAGQTQGAPPPDEARRQLGGAEGTAHSRAAGLLAALTALNFKIAEDAKLASVATQRDAARVRNWMLATAIIGIAVAIGIGLVSARRLSRPVAEMSAALSRVAGGDLDVRLPGHSQDEVGQIEDAMKEMIAVLRTSEARLRALSDNLPDSMVYQLVREPDGTRRFLHVSAGVAPLHGISPESALRDPGLLYGQIHEEDRAAVDAAEARSLATMEVFSVVVRIRKPDGAVRWRNLCSQPRRIGDGRVVWDGIETDITERKRAEAERDQIIRAIELHFDAAIWIDADNRIFYVNAAACRQTGYARSELIGRPLSLVAPGSTPDTLRHDWRVLRTTGCSRIEKIHRRKNGTEYPVEVVASYSVIDGREISCGFARDISERRAVDEILHRRLSELERWQKLTLEREDRVRDLKRQVNLLRGELGLPPEYASVADSSPADGALRAQGTANGNSAG